MLAPHSMSAGILPYCGPYILLGFETKRGWSAFSGRSKPNETAESTAKREFHEETCHIFSATVTDRMHELVRTKTPGGAPFVLYGVKLNRRCNLSKFYENRKIEGSKDCLEKTHLKWFHLNNLPESMRTCFAAEMPTIRHTLREMRFVALSNRQKRHCTLPDTWTDACLCVGADVSENECKRERSEDRRRVES